MSFNGDAFKQVVKGSTDFKTIEEYMNHVNVMRPIVAAKKKEDESIIPTRARNRKIKKLAKPKKVSKKLKITRCSSFGLKEISKNVKNIVKTLKRTTYKEISDIIINEYNESLSDSKDEKNIRRRIYDSLNVMKAMKLFKKDKYEKYILWNGDKNSSNNTGNAKVSNNPVTREDLEELCDEELECLIVYIVNIGK